MPLPFLTLEEMKMLMNEEAGTTTTPLTGSVLQTLKERGETHGDFNEQARISQNLKRVMHDTPNWNSMNDAQRDALEMIAGKASRILAGDACFLDHWHDLAGYALLIRWGAQ